MAHPDEDALGGLWEAAENFLHDDPVFEETRTPGHLSQRFAEASEIRFLSETKENEARNAKRSLHILRPASELDPSGFGAVSVKKESGAKPAVQDHVEHHSGIKVKNRVLSSLQMDQVMQGRRLVPLRSVRSAGTGGDWVVIGVVGEKGDARESSNGKNFVIWKLYDLSGTAVSVFLFGRAYTEHWKETEGSLVAILNPKIMESRERSGVALSVYEGSQIARIGFSAQFGKCRGVRKDGHPCKAVVNRDQGDFCEYHVAGEFRRLHTSRMELNGVRPAPGRAQPQSFKDKSRGTFVVDGVTYTSQKRTVMGPDGKTTTKDTLMSTIRKEMIKGGTVGKLYVQLAGELARTKRPLEAAKGEESDESMRELKRHFGSTDIDRVLGAKSLNAHLAKAEEVQQLDAGMAVLEKKDQLAQEMQKIICIKIKAWHCETCGYTNEAYADFCKRQNHPLKKVDAVKRFFDCEKCKTKNSSLNSRIMKAPCRLCGHEAFTRSSAYKAPVGPKPETFLPRGEERPSLK
eukprot:tig00000842_g4833.t1